AVVMEVPEGTVKSRLHAARLRIRDLMSEPAGAAHAEIMEPGPRSEGTTQSEITTAQTLIPTGPAAEGASIQPTS
ncbi:MAG TPA: hypothetical protein VGS41_16315, partial [Chthonomonadales bacterium]|nr:hypothetical protein [Chthonomonadales bacterium]